MSLHFSGASPNHRNRSPQGPRSLEFCRGQYAPNGDTVCNNNCFSRPELRGDQELRQQLSHNSQHQLKEFNSNHNLKPLATSAAIAFFRALPLSIRRMVVIVVPIFGLVVLVLVVLVLFVVLLVLVVVY